MRCLVRLAGDSPGLVKRGAVSVGGLCRGALSGSRVVRLVAHVAVLRSKLAGAVSLWIADVGAMERREDVDGIDVLRRGGGFRAAWVFAVAEGVDIFVSDVRGRRRRNEVFDGIGRPLPRLRWL